MIENPSFFSKAKRGDIYELPSDTVFITKIISETNALTKKYNFFVWLAYSISWWISDFLDKEAWL